MAVFGDVVNKRAYYVGGTVLMIAGIVQQIVIQIDKPASEKPHNALKHMVQ